MKYITELTFIEDKKKKVMYCENTGIDPISASICSSEQAARMQGVKDCKYKTYELDARNWI